MMASKARLFGDDSALSTILATHDSREHKRLGRQVCHFDHDSWQHERENIGLLGNLAKFSQNENMRLTLLHTGQRRLAEASPHGNLWGIGLRACEYRASSPGTWRGSNLLGQALQHVRETFYPETTPPISDSPPPDTGRPLTHPSDTVFEVDPTTRTRLNTAPIAGHSYNTILSASMDSTPDDHAPKVLLPNARRADKPFISERDPYLISGIVTMDDVKFTTLPSLNKRRLRHIPNSLPRPPGYGIPPIIHIPKCFRADGSHRRRRRILRPIDTTQIVEWLRLPRATQHKPTDPPDHPILPQQCALRTSCGIYIHRP